MLIDLIAPIASIEPPKIIVAITKKIVFNIPIIPPVEKSSFKISLSVVIETLLVIVSITTLYEAIIVVFEESDSSLIICG